MAVEFPVFVLAKDCGEVHQAASLDEINYHLEAIDAENDEFELWDSTGQIVRLVAVGLSTFRSGKIAVEATGQFIQPEALDDIRRRVEPW